MIDFAKYQKLKADWLSAKSSYEYAIRYLNQAMKEFEWSQHTIEVNSRPHGEEPTEDSKLTDTTVLVNGFLNLVENTKDYYDAKAKFEELDAEYQRQTTIFELEEEIDRVINRIRYTGNSNYVDEIKLHIDKLMELIR